MVGSGGSGLSVSESLLGRRVVFDNGKAKEVRLSYKEVRYGDGDFRKVSLSYREVRFEGSKRLGS